MAPFRRQNSLQNVQSKLGAMVRYNVFQYAVEFKHMERFLYGLLGSWKLWEWDEVGHLAEAIHHGKNDHHPV